MSINIVARVWLIRESPKAKQPHAVLTVEHGHNLWNDKLTQNSVQSTNHLSKVREGKKYICTTVCVKTHRRQKW